MSTKYYKFLTNSLVVCINNKIYTRFTIDKKYDVDYVDSYHMLMTVFNNLGGEDIIDIEENCFITLKEYEILHRKDKINKILK